MRPLQNRRLRILEMSVFEAIQAAVRFFVRAAYAFVAHLVLMAVAFLFMLFLDLVGFAGRNALEISLWEYFWLALSFPIPFLGYAMWATILLNMIPERGLFICPAWARDQE